MGITESALTGLRGLIREGRGEEAIRLCATAFDVTEASVREIASRVSELGLFTIAEAIARTIDADDTTRAACALTIGIAVASEFALDPDNSDRGVVERLARKMARLPA